MRLLAFYVSPFMLYLSFFISHWIRQTRLDPNAKIRMPNLKWKMKNGKGGRGLLWLCLLWVTLAPSVSAQAANAKLDADPLHQLNNSVRALVKRVTPSVVQVLVTGYGPVEGSPGDTNLVLGKQQSLGSGVIIDPDGYIVTNAHVLRGAHRVQVKLPERPPMKHRTDHSAAEAAL